MNGTMKCGDLGVENGRPLESRFRVFPRAPTDPPARLAVFHVRLELRQHAFELPSEPGSEELHGTVLLPRDVVAHGPEPGLEGFGNQA